MGIFPEGYTHYWDVFPRSIKLSLKAEAPPIPLSVRGYPRGQVFFESQDQSVASVDEDGLLWPGWQAGSTVVMAYDSWDETSVRYVQVEIIDYGGGEWEEENPDEF